MYLYSLNPCISFIFHLSSFIFHLSSPHSQSEDGKIVVMLDNNVYDISTFDGHPGGVGRLQMASGGDLAVYWKVYMQHNRGHIDKIMGRYHIGYLSEAEGKKVSEATVFDNPYTNDPPTSPHLLTNTRYPYNAEAKTKDLRKSFITKPGVHFMRNHNMVPQIDPDEYRLTICGEGMEETVFTLQDLKNKFEKVSVTTVIQCNGNRREDYHYLDGKTPAFGPPHWVCGAIGCSTWSGVRLRDLYRAAGMDVDGISLGKVSAPQKATSVGLLAYDCDEVGNQYCCSFPFEKSLDPFGDVIVAYEMNGKDIPRGHGYPVRCIVPGNAGARNCKYLERVTVTDSPCSDNSNWKQYAVHAADTPLHKLLDFGKHKKELEKDQAVQQMPVQSFVTTPAANDVLAAKINVDEDGDYSVWVEGISWGGGGQGINRVDVSVDGGKHFVRADLLEKPIPKERYGSCWSWQFFEKRVKLPPHMVEQIKRGEKVTLDVCSKALNSAWNVQPETPQANWNAHGCCVNHWYRVPCTFDPKAPKDAPYVPDVESGEFVNKPSGGKFTKPFTNTDVPEVAKKRGNKDLCID
jgi:sulfite oxidase